MWDFRAQFQINRLYWRNNFQAARDKLAEAGEKFKDTGSKLYKNIEAGLQNFLKKDDAAPAAAEPAA